MVSKKTLATAIYCTLKYPHDFKYSNHSAVNHDGDSDSTGAVIGNIVGVYLCLDAIPMKYINYLELKGIILEIADDIIFDCQMNEYGSYHNKIWKQKFIKCSFAPT
jgi:ADP-ribosylglycohydrolase